MPECFYNGTIGVVVPKLESVPRLLPGELSLRDPACKPYYNEAHFAFFRFDVTTCGTTRTVRWGHSHQAFTLLLLFDQMIYSFTLVCRGHHEIWECGLLEERWAFAPDLRISTWARIQVMGGRFPCESFIVYASVSFAPWNKQGCV